jgi:GNAT superfamily N-acetyltransferase
MNVRRATQVDLPGLEVIRQQAIESAFTDEYDRQDFAHLVATPEDRLEGWITGSSHLVLVGESEVTEVCFGVLERETGTIRGLYTAPNHAGHGCASAILERFEAAAREEGLDHLEVAAPLNAVGFFESRGFERPAVEEVDVDRGAIERLRLVKPTGAGDSPSPDSGEGHSDR